jgi:hypothetical protein
MPIARVAQNFHACRREEQKYAVAIFVRVIELQERSLFVVYGDGLAPFSIIRFLHVTFFCTGRLIDLRIELIKLRALSSFGQ